MKVKSAPKKQAQNGEKFDAVLRTRVPATLKERVERFCKIKLRNEGQVVREAVLEWADKNGA